jgi:hypothetical protein
MLASRMTRALHLLPQSAISRIRLRAPLSSLALFHKSENQLSCFQFRAHDFGEMGGGLCPPPRAEVPGKGSFGGKKVRVVLGRSETIEQTGHGPRMQNFKLEARK